MFGANNVELVSKTRTEHVPKSEREKRAARAPPPLAGLLALADADVQAADKVRGPWLLYVLPDYPRK